MLASFVVAAVLAACPPAGPVAPVADLDTPAPDALIACVGADPITGELFSHWLVVARKGVPDAPAKQAREQVMQFLVSGKWLEGEAADRGIRVSDRAVRRRFNAQKHEAFRTEREFREFLDDSGMTRSDLKYRVKLDLLSERLRKATAGSGSRRAQQRRLNRFVVRFHRKWSARTSCQAGYAIEDCGATLATS